MDHESPMTTQFSYIDQFPELPRYFEVPGGYLYTVLHDVEDPIARVLLVGPFASERQNSYLPWVKWARHLAARRIEVLRFDYRGVGESSGAFEEMTFRHWMEDVRLIAKWFAGRMPRIPFVLHGLETGALLAGNCFQDGLGDALLLWSPPLSANQALRSTLLRWVGLEQMLVPGAERKKASDYIQLLTQDQPIEVEGYQWSAELWKDSFNWKLADNYSGSGDLLVNKKPVRLVNLPGKAAPLVKGGFVGYDEAKDFEWLFGENSTWIADQTSSAARQDDDRVG